MADIDIDSFGDQDKTKSKPDGPMGENISLTPGGGSIWDPVHEEETSFGEESQRTKFMKELVKGLYRKLSESMGKPLEAFHFDYFELRDGELYYKGKSKPLNRRRGAKISW